MPEVQISNIPPELFTHIVQDEDSLDGLSRKLYTTPTTDMLQNLKNINKHLGDRVMPGQLVIIGPESNQMCTRYYPTLSGLGERINNKLNKMTDSERKILAKYHELLANIASYSSTGYGLSMTYFAQHKKHVEQILQDIQREYVNSYNRHGNLKNIEFLRSRRVMFEKLKLALDRMVGHQSMGLDFEAESIKRSLGLNTKSIIKQWKKQVGPVKNIEGFEENFVKIGKYSKTLKHFGYIGIGLDVGQSVIKIHEACTINTENECKKTEFKESGRLVGSVGGGAAGGWAAYGVCNLVFGFESAGTSLLWCGIVAAGAGGYFGGSYFGKVGKSGGNLIYQHYYK